MKLGKISILLLLGMLLVYTGCKKKIIGREIDADKRVPLVKGSQQTGEWRVFEFIMDYKYLYTPSKAGAPGSIKFSGSFRKSGGRLDGLTIWIYLLDGNGRVLDRKSIFDSPYKAERYMERSINVTLATPPETTGISFRHVDIESSSRDK